MNYPQIMSPCPFCL